MQRAIDCGVSNFNECIYDATPVCKAQRTERLGSRKAVRASGSGDCVS